MRLALISPKGVAMGTDEENKRTRSIYEQLNHIESLKELMSCPNLPLLAVGALAKDDFDDIVYIDEEIETIPWNTPFDMVAMSFMTQQATRAFELADKFREMGTYLIAGGMHPTNSPEETLQYYDTVFIGEAEITWSEFISDFRKGLPKKTYVNDCEIDMNQVPIPRYDLLNMTKYKTIPIQISRGCPHNCEFCASTKVYGPRYRHKSVERVLQEIEIVKSYKKNPHIYFTDDNMLVNKKMAIRLLDGMKDGGFRWMTHTDISVADHDDVLERLYPSGCRKLVIGFESIVPESLKNIEKWKYRRLDSYGESIAKIQSHGIGVWGTFIVGLDSDDKSVFQRVIDFTMNNHLYGAMISVPTPFPGSRFYSRLEEEGRILTRHWGSYTLWNVVVRPTNMTVQELQDGFEYTLNQIYSKEASLRRMTHFKEIFQTMRR
ncbi:radical SAM protein [Paenibacillus sp. M1]|uniref:Radical SAM protein n=1 Tax=Paenibacillus haidiansis TaxID=1574488 RepID=A0ABU7VQ80_9BACL